MRIAQNTMKVILLLPLYTMMTFRRTAESVYMACCIQVLLSPSSNDPKYDLHSFDLETFVKK
jgi:hypothetical protein